jgi:hypothetical protein
MVQAKTEDGKWKTVPMYEKGMEINYTNANGTQSGIVLAVHQNNMMEPYYTVLLQDGNEKQTDNAHIMLRVEDYDDGLEEAAAGNSGVTLDDLVEEPAPSRMTDVDDNLCVVCAESRKRVALLPCKHMCLCQGCATECLFNTLNECPMCRARISDSMEVFW